MKHNWVHLVHETVIFWVPELVERTQSIKVSAFIFILIPPYETDVLMLVVKRMVFLKCNSSEHCILISFRTDLETTSAADSLVEEEDEGPL